MGPEVPETRAEVRRSIRECHAVLHSDASRRKSIRYCGKSARICCRVRQPSLGQPWPAQADLGQTDRPLQPHTGQASSLQHPWWHLTFLRC